MHPMHQFDPVMANKILEYVTNRLEMVETPLDGIL
ncbi:MAG: hypothetical protein RIT32_353, partial [Actinomycetota bacterium]